MARSNHPSLKLARMDERLLDELCQRISQAIRHHSGAIVTALDEAESAAIRDRDQKYPELDAVVQVTVNRYPYSYAEPPITVLRVEVRAR